jgi:hypothetical protein
LTKPTESEPTESEPGESKPTESRSEAARSSLSAPRGGPATPAPGAAAHAGRRPRPESYSEATRLLCAGVHLDVAFRHRVIEELVEQRQRTVAPSLGVDIVPVLAHALRCRRREAQIALWLALVWFLFFVFDIALSTIPIAFMSYAAVCVLAWISRVVSGRGGSLTDRRLSGRLGHLRLLPGLLQVIVLMVGVGYWGLAVSLLAKGRFAAALFPLLLALPFWAHRAWSDRVIRDELSRERFRARPRLELPAAYAWLGAAIDTEQYARLTVYDAFEPFVGYGKPYEPWSFAVELRQRTTPGQDAAAGPPLTSRKVIDLVVPKVAALRRSAASTSRDRLRALDIEHLAYLPTSPRRGEAGYHEAGVDWHVAQAVDEGAEARRYFLRIRVGAWDEQVVVSVLVRVHTQGGMLVLEVVPHVLYPVRPEFREVDTLAARSNAGGRGFVRALAGGPAANVAAAVSLAGTIASLFRTWLTDPAVLPGEAPVASVRELGSKEEVSLFQEMDISRYVKTIQDRIASGVTDALEECGYETDRFTQQIFNISEGGMFIGQMSGGAVAQGSGAAATQQTGGGTQ